MWPAAAAKGATGTTGAKDAAHPMGGTKDGAKDSWDKTRSGADKAVDDTGKAMDKTGSDLKKAGKGMW